MKTEFYNYKPNLGCTTNEPSLREIVFNYYHKQFDTEESQELTNEYFQTLLRHYLVLENEFK